MAKRPGFVGKVLCKKWRQSSRHALHQFASQAEWRLPNIKELVSLTEMACFGPAMNSRAFAQGFKYETGNILMVRNFNPNHQVWQAK
ncbi:DUF1566 domain-containing protein [Vibrio anguillarum]|uniref:Lcl domain-containing protein n=1 Tax=Vibrio anguillarum TaxID=55601 RepID=UPI003BAAD305